MVMGGWWPGPGSLMLGVGVGSWLMVVGVGGHPPMGVMRVEAVVVHKFLVFLHGGSNILI
jgi:hypothetical protein